MNKESFFLFSKSYYLLPECCNIPIDDYFHEFCYPLCMKLLFLNEKPSTCWMTPRKFDELSAKDIIVATGSNRKKFITPPRSICSCKTRLLLFVQNSADLKKYISVMCFQAWREIFLWVVLDGTWQIFDMTTTIDSCKSKENNLSTRDKSPSRFFLQRCPSHTSQKHWENSSNNDAIKSWMNSK